MPPSRAFVVVENQTVTDIMNLIRYKHEKHARDYDKIADFFWTGTVEGTAKKLFDWCRNNIKYKVENEERQTVSSPQKILIKQQGDCKHYASFIAGVLDALDRQGKKIDWYYRFASYNPFDDNPGHVFVIVKKGGKEIWIDPVLEKFNYQKPFQYAIDKKVKTAVMSGINGYGYVDVMPKRSRLGLSAMSAVDCVRASNNNAVGSSTAQTGQLIMKVAPTLAAVPVVGWIAGAAGTIVGGIISVIGSKWNQSPDVRWLIQLYQFYVLNQPGVTSDNKTTESLSQQAQAFFSVVLGVPIGGRKDFNILQSGDGNTNTPTNQTSAQRAANYIAWKGLQGKIDPAQAQEAAEIAATLNPQKFKAGGWAGLTAAPSVIDYTAAKSGLSTAAGSNIMAAGFLGNLPPWLIPVVIVGVLLLFTSPKGSTHGKGKKTTRRRR